MCLNAGAVMLFNQRMTHGAELIDGVSTVIQAVHTRHEGPDQSLLSQRMSEDR